jgi:predicted TIM-barrel fold metal-dependent hydrolase
MFFDIHAHMYKYPYPLSYDEKKGYQLVFPNGEELIKMHDNLGIERAVILPLVSAESYVPQSVGEVIDFCNASNGRFIPFCNIDPRVLDNKKDTDLGFLIEFYKKQGCKGMGEVLPNMEFSDPKLQNLFYHCEKAELPLLFDCSGYKGEDYGIYDDVGLPQLRKSLEKFPNLTFIGHGPAFWAELEKIEENEVRQNWLSTPLKGEGVVPKYMREYKNLWVDLSAGSGYCAMTRDIEYAKQFLNEFWDRITFGTDICFAEEKPKRVLIDLLNTFHETGVLNDEKFEAITHKNTERLLKL